MRSRGGRTIKITPVDEDHHQVQDHPDRGRIEALMDQNLFRLHIRRERSSAYWFAASLWGISGLVMGALLGVYITLAVQTGSADIWRDNFIAGAAADAAQDSVNSRDPIIQRDNPNQ
jgi:hypothetical protein